MGNGSECLWELMKEHSKESWLDHAWASAWVVSRVQKSRARLWADELDRSTACALALSLGGKSMAEKKGQPLALLKGVQLKGRAMAIPMAPNWASTRGKKTACSRDRQSG